MRGGGSGRRPAASERGGGGPEGRPPAPRTVWPAPAGDASSAVPGRRAFLVRAGRSAAGLASLSALPLAASCAGLPVVTPELDGRTARIPHSAFDASGAVLFPHPDGGRAVYVHRHGPRRFSAVLTRCTHRGCQVEPEGRRLVCPCHGSEYTLEGGLLNGPARQPLTRYATTAGDTHVLVRLDAGGRDG